MAGEGSQHKREGPPVPSFWWWWLLLLSTSLALRWLFPSLSFSCMVVAAPLLALFVAAAFFALSLPPCLSRSHCWWWPLLPSRHSFPLPQKNNHLWNQYKQLRREVPPKKKWNVSTTKRRERNTIRPETSWNDFVFFGIIQQIRIRFLSLRIFFNDSNFWYVQSSITHNVAVHVHVLWPVCAHTIPFRMLWCP